MAADDEIGPVDKSVEVKRYPFQGMLTFDNFALLVTSDRAGVEHPRCGLWAAVSPELDSTYCVGCGWQERISGGWYLDMLDHTRGRSEPSAWTYDPLTGEPIIHLGPRDDATEQEALGDPEWDDDPEEEAPDA